ncbi:MAG: cytidyltransferase [Nitrosomonadaceae bacterium]|nr:cytidyltransferase [Nitrosomonadaceae bacterium]|tara:strand:+ start:9793 stop:11316 length:1524 start_codon:yes stop_codon:yes gene_type:complete
MTAEKIVSIEEIARYAKGLRKEGKRVVLCHGAFDLMHSGHIRYLQRAKQEGDILLVTVTADSFVNKGPGRPVFGEQLRAENIAALACVDQVAINNSLSAVDALNKIRPNIYAKGAEYRSHGDDVTGNISREQQAVEKYGGNIFYTDEVTFSSSSLLNEYFNVFPSETKLFLQDFRSRWTDKDIHQQLASLSDLKVLVVGDAIIDQYHYSTPLGQTGKGNVLAVRYDSEEQFAGGAIAVANHIAGFVNSVTLATGLGQFDSHEQFIRSKLLSNVSPQFFYFKDAPTVTKRRFVDGDMFKFFEIYFFKEEMKLSDEGENICKWLDDNLAFYDVVIVPDFGNGLITSDMIKVLGDKAKYLVVNTQINSGNRGYHVIHKYSRVDFASLNEPELRMAAYNRHDPLEAVIKKISGLVEVQQIATTRGTKGVIVFDKKDKVFHRVPALSTRVVDRIGAGDAFLSLAGLCAGKGLSAEVAAFVGSVAAAMDVQIICNREPIDPVSLNKYVSTLLK